MPDVFPYDTMAVTGKVRHSVYDAQMGEGYRQVVSTGFNARQSDWPFTATGTKAYIEEIAEWLDDHIGQVFLYTPPVGAEAAFISKDYDMNGIDTDSWTISALFEEVALP